MGQTLKKLDIVCGSREEVERKLKMNENSKQTAPKYTYNYLLFKVNNREKK
ncbi:MAG: hypothetical protein P8Y97_14025 [Candidatus Lokiarchaeota archaeon]